MPGSGMGARDAREPIARDADAQVFSLEMILGIASFFVMFLSLMFLGGVIIRRKRRCGKVKGNTVAENNEKADATDEFVVDFDMDQRDPWFLGYVEPASSQQPRRPIVEV